MNAAYAVQDVSAVLSPSLLFFKDLIRQNTARVLEMVGGNPAKLRPHIKTHKTREIVRLQLEVGITKHKCATIAEAELLARTEAPDVLLAYPLVGPNCGRFATLVKTYPGTRFSVTVDSQQGVALLSAAMRTAGVTAEALIDLDVGQHRTGIPAGPAAVELYEQIARSPGLTPGGFHVYDGHNHQPTLAERTEAVNALLGPVFELRTHLEAKGLPVPRVVCGGTPTFPVYSTMDFPGLECSPGTFILHDVGYGGKFPDLTGFTPAALLLTRVISRPSPTRMTLDLGYKAVASDPPAGKRVQLLDVPDAEAVLQNEEHLVIETPAAENYHPGDALFAIPTHVCPTCALHRQVYVVEAGKVIGTWEIAARDRSLGI